MEGDGSPPDARRVAAIHAKGHGMIICRTPYRISFFGGGTDYPGWYRHHGGAVLAAAIDKFCYLTCRYLPPFFEHRIRVVYRKIETCQSVEEVSHPTVRETLRHLKLHVIVQVPDGRHARSFVDGLFDFRWDADIFKNETGQLETVLGADHRIDEREERATDLAIARRDIQHRDFRLGQRLAEETDNA